MSRVVAILLLAATRVGYGQQAQPGAAAQFDVVSIKRNMSAPEAGGRMRTLPDGTFRMTNHPISSIIRGASSVPVSEVVGLPRWAETERYDVIAKPPPGPRASSGPRCGEACSPSG
jgi:hypothetical protein